MNIIKWKANCVMEKETKYAYQPQALEQAEKAFPELERHIEAVTKRRIAKLEAEGLFLDMIEQDGQPKYLECVERLYTNPQSRFYVPGFRLADHFEAAKEFTLSGQRHTLVHVKPESFTFSYVDFGNMDAAWPKLQFTYANSFWAIYVKSDRLKIHDLIQYDVFKKCFCIRPYNIYDGGNGLLRYAGHGDYRGFCGNNHNSGMVYSGFGDLAKVRESVITARAALAEKRVQEFQRLIEKEKADCEKETAEFISELKELAEIEKAGGASAV